MLKLKMVTRIFLYLLISISLISCSKDDYIKELDEWEYSLKKLYEKRDLWNSFKISNYEMSQQIFCFCYPEDFLMPKYIIVFDGNIKLINGSNPEDTIGYESFYTINSLFDFIERKLKENPVVFQIEYDQEYGYPISMYFDISEMIADEEVGYSISDFKTLNND